MARADCTDTINNIALFPATPLTWKGWTRDGGNLIKQVSLNVLNTLKGWQRRAEQRQHMAEMSERMLGDIGLTRADLAREAEKPFWQA